MGIRLAPADGFGLWARLFGPLGKKRAFYTVCAYFRPILVFKEYFNGRGEEEQGECKNQE